MRRYCKDNSFIIIGDLVVYRCNTNMLDNGLEKSIEISIDGHCIIVAKIKLKRQNFGFV